MANKPSDPISQGTLQRGKACLRCRKRKMRCDGVKPACQQCTRAKKADGCEYDDGKGKTRTQILRETITKLENRIRELEDPNSISTSIALFDPHLHSRSNSSSSSLGSPESSYLSVSHSPFPSDSSPISPAWSQQRGFSSPSPLIPDIFCEDNSFPQVVPSPELAQTLIDIFTPHARQCGIEVSISDIKQSVASPLAPKRHPVLLNAIFLCACFVSRPEPLSQHEEHYLDQALAALPDALRCADSILDAIQASCLLAVYFLSNGRFVEGNYHASAAASMCVQSGLGKRAEMDNQKFSDGDFKLHKGDTGRAETILTFWQVYNLDRCWSVVLRRPAIVPDDDMSQHGIYCPWPQDIKDYQKGHFESDTSVPTIRAFLSGTVSPSSFSLAALRVKASALFAQADYLAAAWSSGVKSSTNLLEETRTLEHTITLFLSTLIPVNQLDAVVAEEKTTLVMAHTLAQAAIVHLHRSLALDDATSYSKCSQAARVCVSIIRQLSEQEFQLLEPLIGFCWWSVADILLRDLDTMEASWPLIDAGETRAELGVLLYALTNITGRFPIVAPAMSKLQKRLS